MTVFVRPWPCHIPMQWERREARGVAAAVTAGWTHRARIPVGEYSSHTSSAQGAPRP